MVACCSQPVNKKGRPVMDNAYIPRTQRGAFFNLAAWVVALVLLGGAVAGGLWAFGVFTAPAAGKGGAFKQQQSANNRIFAQATFEQENADIDGYIAKVAVARQAVAADPTSINKTNLVGVEQQCIDTVQQYNADSAKYLLRDFKSAGLPPTRDPKECK